MAVSFYLSTLALQSTFEPARDRLLSIQCSRNSPFSAKRNVPNLIGRGGGAGVKTKSIATSAPTMKAPIKEN